MNNERVHPFSFNKNLLKCQNADHELARFKFICTDLNCKIENKLACAECILEDHKDHKYVLLEQFAGNVGEKFQKMNKSVKEFEQESNMTDFQMTLNQEVKSEFEEIKL